ncbi:helix-turn-helix domain-containing protein [Secundilactobacillus muriivasis]
MTTKKTFYNPETETNDLYTEKYITETVTVKDLSDLQVQHHYWEDSDGELWGDFEHPMENVEKDFEAYRNQKGFMQPTDILKLRKKLGLTVREFANRLDIGASTLSQIENNQRLQTGYQNNLFKWANNEPFNDKKTASQTANSEKNSTWSSINKQQGSILHLNADYAFQPTRLQKTHLTLHASLFSTPHLNSVLSAKQLNRNWVNANSSMKRLNSISNSIKNGYNFHSKFHSDSIKNARLIPKSDSSTHV